MATVLKKGSITASIVATLTQSLDLSTPTDALSYEEVIKLTDGTGASQADMGWHDTRTIAASSNEDLDFAGSLTDGFGNTLTFKEIKAVLIVASSSNTNNVQVTQAAANGVPNLFLAAGDGVSVYPGGVLLWANPGDGGPTVTAGTGDLINVANSGAGTGVTYDIIVLGTSA